jgi:hypothetical protein
MNQADGLRCHLRESSKSVDVIGVERWAALWIRFSEDEIGTQKIVEQSGGGLTALKAHLGNEKEWK